MTDATASGEQRRPSTSRMNSESSQIRPINNRSTSMDKLKRENKNQQETPQENRNSVLVTSDPPNSTKAKKKPRKLALRNAQPKIIAPALAEEKSTGVETKEASLDSRVSALESEYRRLHKRTDSNTVDIGRLQALKITPDFPISKEPTEHAKVEAFPTEQDYHRADSTSPLGDERKETHLADLQRVEELSDEEIETIPRPVGAAVGGTLDQNRSVALKGSYKIPLPPTLSTDDVRAVQSGLAAAGTVAREIATAMRGSRFGSGSGPNETRQKNNETSTSF